MAIAGRLLAISLFAVVCLITASPSYAVLPAVVAVEGAVVVEETVFGALLGWIARTFGARVATPIIEGSAGGIALDSGIGAAARIAPNARLFTPFAERRALTVLTARGATFEVALGEFRLANGTRLVRILIATDTRRLSRSEVGFLAATLPLYYDYVSPQEEWKAWVKSHCNGGKGVIEVPEDKSKRLSGYCVQQSRSQGS